MATRRWEVWNTFHDPMRASIFAKVEYGKPKNIMYWKTKVKGNWLVLIAPELTNIDLPVYAFRTLKQAIEFVKLKQVEHALVVKGS